MSGLVKTDAVTNTAGTGPFSASYGTLIPIVTKTTTYIATAQDEVILADATSAAFTITLPAASTAGKVICITKSDSSSNIVTVARAGSDTIAGVTSRLIKTPYAQLRLVSDGTATWYVLGDTTAQVIQTTKTDTFTDSSATGTWVDITGLSVSITPSSTATKILVSAAISMSCNSVGAAAIRLQRDGSTIYVGDAAGSRPQQTGTNGVPANADQSPTSVTIEYVDSPASVSSLTYKLQAATFFATSVYINRTGNDTDDANHGRTVSSITVKELNYQ